MNDIKCCQLLDTMKGANGMFADKLREEKYMTEIIRYNLAVLTQLEMLGCLCKTCLDYKKEYLEPVLPKFKEILDSKRNVRTN